MKGCAGRDRCGARHEAEEIRQIGAFRQFDHRKHAQQGLGLGLLLVQKLVARNHAKIAISRRPERGMEISIEFQLGAGES